MTWLLLVVAFIVCLLAGHFIGWKAGRYGMKPSGPDIGGRVHPFVSRCEIEATGPLQYHVAFIIDHTGGEFRHLSIRSCRAYMAEDAELFVAIDLAKNESQYGAG